MISVIVWENDLNDLSDGHGKMTSMTALENDLTDLSDGECKCNEISLPVPEDVKKPGTDRTEYDRNRYRKTWKRQKPVQTNKARHKLVKTKQNMTETGTERQRHDRNRYRKTKT